MKLELARPFTCRPAISNRCTPLTPGDSCEQAPAGAATGRQAADGSRVGAWVAPISSFTRQLTPGSAGGGAAVVSRLHFSPARHEPLQQESGRCGPGSPHTLHAPLQPSPPEVPRA